MMIRNLESQSIAGVANLLFAASTRTHMHVHTYARTHTYIHVHKCANPTEQPPRGAHRIMQILAV